MTAQQNPEILEYLIDMATPFTLRTVEMFACSATCFSIQPVQGIVSTVLFKSQVSTGSGTGSILPNRKM